MSLDNTPDYIDVNAQLGYGKFANIESWLQRNGRVLQGHDYFEETRHIVYLGSEHTWMKLTHTRFQDSHDVVCNEIPSFDFEPDIVAMDGYGLEESLVVEAVERYGAQVVYVPTEYLLSVLAGLSAWSSAVIEVVASNGVKAGHQGLELVRESKPFDWPTLEDVGRTDRRGEPEEFHDGRDLSDYGYSVARDGLTPPERHDVLKEVVGEYGLRAVARKLTGFVLTRQRNDPDTYEAAIRKWEFDLKWLKERYYDTARTDWKWPYVDHRGD